MNTVAQDLLELIKFDSLKYYIIKNIRLNVKISKMPDMPYNWMANYYEQPTNDEGYTKQCKYYTWMYCFYFISYEFNDLFTESDIIKVNVSDSIITTLNKLKDSKVVDIVKDKIHGGFSYYNHALHAVSNGISYCDEVITREMDHVDYNYVAIIYISLIKKLFNDDKNYNISKFMVFKKDIVDKAFDIIKQSLDNVLINDINKIITNYVASGNDIIYI